MKFNAALGSGNMLVGGKVTMSLDISAVNKPKIRGHPSGIGGFMGGSDDQLDSVNPSEQRGGPTPGEQEAREKGPWAATAGEGVVPAELGGSDAPSEMLSEDPELGSSVLGSTTGSEEPATDAGIDAGGGQNADATSDGGPDRPKDAEPDLKDAAAGPRPVDMKSAE